VTIFQLDECLNDANLAEACNAAGECTVRRYPRRLKQKTDDEMLPVVFLHNTTLVTTDRTIVDDNAASILFPNPGIIVIQKKNPHPPMTSVRAQRIIEKFKHHVPSWSTIDWSMVYAEIDENEVFLSPLVDSDTSKGKPFLIVGNEVDVEIAKYISAIHEWFQKHVLPLRR
jgi:hypothetical protein